MCGHQGPVPDLGGSSLSLWVSRYLSTICFVSICREPLPCLHRMNILEDLQLVLQDGSKKDTSYCLPRALERVQRPIFLLGAPMCLTRLIRPNR